MKKVTSKNETSRDANNDILESLLAVTQFLASDDDLYEEEEAQENLIDEEMLNQQSIVYAYAEALQDKAGIEKVMVALRQVGVSENPSQSIEFLLNAIHDSDFRVDVAISQKRRMEDSLCDSVYEYLTTLYEGLPFDINDMSVYDLVGGPKRSLVVSAVPLEQLPDDIQVLGKIGKIGKRVTFVHKSAATDEMTLVKIKLMSFLKQAIGNDRVRQKGEGTFVEENRKKDETNKRLAALFALRAMDLLSEYSEYVNGDIHPFENGDGCFLDAGSSLIPLWEEVFRKKIIEGYFQHSWIYTPSYLIFKDWMDNAKAIPWNNLELMGAVPDRDHGALYGEGLSNNICKESLRLAAMFIGCAGLEFTEKSIFFGHHGTRDLEGVAKESYFRSHAKIKIILASPTKVNFVPAARSFDILSLKGLTKGPIVLITAEPKGDATYNKRFNEAKETCRSIAFKEQLEEKGITFVWFIISDELDEHGVPYLRDVVSTDKIEAAMSEVIRKKPKLKADDSKDQKVVPIR